jgi:hypothetical protein
LGFSRDVDPIRWPAEVGFDGRRRAQVIGASQNVPLVFLLSPSSMPGAKPALTVGEMAARWNLVCTGTHRIDSCSQKLHLQNVFLS